MEMVASDSNPLSEPTDNTNTNTSSNSIPSSNDGKGEEKGPQVCLLKFASDTASGALMGSIFGIGSGLVQRKGFKESLVEGASSAKTFAILSGVHSFVNCFLKILRGKDDAINAGISGCVTGLALNVPGTPQALLQGCVTFGAFSYIIEAFYKHQEANALPLSRTLRQSQNSPRIAFPVLPPYTLPSPFFKSISAIQPAEPHTASKHHK